MLKMLTSIAALQGPLAKIQSKYSPLWHQQSFSLRLHKIADYAEIENSFSSTSFRTKLEWAIQCIHGSHASS